MALDLDAFIEKWGFGWRKVMDEPREKARMKADLEEMLERAREDAYPKE